MKIYRLKKKNVFSLIVLMVCCVLLYSSNSYLNMTGFINSKIELIKEKEMKYMFGQRNSLVDKYSESSIGYNISNVSLRQNELKLKQNTKLASSNYKKQGFLLLGKQNINVNMTMSDYLASYAKYQAAFSELKKQIEEDTYRNKKLGFYYVFNYEYTMDALKELEPEIEKIANAQKMPKALLTAVLFREMMFMGQEDLLDGVKVIGGKTMGICQIGIDNVKANEKIVHGDKSLVDKDTDDEIKEMLQNPKQAVYFCAVQLRARSIQLTGKTDLNDLNQEQMQKVLAEYNQSSITVNIGPIMTKSKYAEETYKYYKLFLKYYELETTK